MCTLLNRVFRSTTVASSLIFHQKSTMESGKVGMTQRRWKNFQDSCQCKRGRTPKSKLIGMRHESSEPSMKPGLVLEKSSLWPEFFILYLFWKILKCKICSLNFGLNILFTVQWSSIYQSFRKQVQPLQMLSYWHICQWKLFLTEGRGPYVIVPLWHLHPRNLLPKYYRSITP